MQIVDIYLQSYEFARARTLATLASIDELPAPLEVLAWRPGQGRAPIGWQLMHIGITEDVIATERFAPHKQGRFTELWPQFRGGSTPNDHAPLTAEIRAVLAGARAVLVETLRELTEERLGEIPPAWAARGWTIGQGLALIAWHEAHHQGQAHLTLNLYKAAHGMA